MAKYVDRMAADGTAHSDLEAPSQTTRRPGIPSIQSGAIGVMQMNSDLTLEDQEEMER
jgi:hypothetical protein